MATKIELDSNKRNAKNANDGDYVFVVEAVDAKGATIKNVDNDTVAIEGNAADYIVKATGAGVIVTKNLEGLSGAELKAAKQFKLTITLQKENAKKGVDAGVVTLAFADGAIDLTRDGKNIVTGEGVVVTKKAKEAGALDIEIADETFGSVTAEEPTEPQPGQSFTLTADADTFFGDAGKDNVITGAAGTLDANDIIIDQSATDSDVLNVTVQSGEIGALNVVAAVVRGIENINVNIDAITGQAATYDAANTTGATITLSSERVGFNGVAGVLNAGANNVTAGSSVTTLTVDGLTTGVVNAGAATTVNVDTEEAQDTANVTVNGNVTVNVTDAETAVITGTAAAVVTLTGNQLNTVTVNGPVSIEAATAALGDLDLTGATLVTKTDAGAADLSGIAAPIALEVAENGTVTVASGASVALLANNTGLTLNTARANGTVNVSTAVDQTTVNAGANVTTVNLSVTDEVEITTLNTGAAALNIETAADLTIAALTSTGDVVITGSGNVEITAATNANSIDVSGLAGTLTVETNGQEVTIIGGAQLADVTLGSNGETAVIIAGSGGSRVNANALTNGDTLVFQGGTGTDTLVVENGANLSTATLTLSSVEAIELAGATAGADNFAMTFSAAQLSGQSFNVTAEAAQANDVVTLNVAAGDATTINLGGLTLTNIDSVVIDASAGSAASAVTITGTSVADIIDASNNGDTINAGAGNDEITGGTGRDTINAGAGDDTVNASQGADTITLGAGNDVVVYTHANQSLTAVDTVANLRASLDVITDWAAGGTNQIDLSGVAGITTFVDQATTQATVDALAADATLLDAFTAVEGQLTAGQVSVFQFGGNTYVFADLDNAALNANDLAIELTGQQSLIAANFVLV